MGINALSSSLSQCTLRSLLLNIVFFVETGLSSSLCLNGEILPCNWIAFRLSTTSISYPYILPCFFENHVVARQALLDWLSSFKLAEVTLSGTHTISLSSFHSSHFCHDTRLGWSQCHLGLPSTVTIKETTLTKVFWCHCSNTSRSTGQLLPRTSRTRRKRLACSRKL